MRVLRFDGFTLDVSRRTLLYGAKELALRPQAFDVLVHLTEHAGSVVSKGDLIAAVWQAKPASDDSIVQCITDIRHALGDRARSIIRTVPRRGYVFMAPIAVLEAPPLASAASHKSSSDTPSGVRPRDDAPVPEHRSRLLVAPHLWHRNLIAAGLLITLLVAGGWLAWQRAPPPVLTMMAVPTVAVLPFEPLGADPAEASAARALHDDVTTEISRQVNGGMISFKSTAGYRGGAEDLKTVGRLLDARYLLLGTVRREAEELHVSVRLIEAESGRQLWAEPFRYTAGQRDAAALRITDMLGNKLIAIESQRPLPARPEAAHFTILAIAILRNERDAAANKAALGLFEKALELDPNTVPALLGYARAQIHHVRDGWAPANEHEERLSKAKDAVDRAIKLAPRNGAAYHHRAQLLRLRGDLDGATAAIGHALSINPNSAGSLAWLGRMKIDAGLAHEAIAHIEEAIRLNPANPALYLWCSWAGRAAVHTGDYAVAIQWLQKARQADPSFPSTVPWLAVAYAGVGREEEARALIKEHMNKGYRLTIAGWKKRQPWARGILAEQRARIAAVLKRLGVPEGKVQTGSAQ